MVKSDGRKLFTDERRNRRDDGGPTGTDAAAAAATAAATRDGSDKRSATKLAWRGVDREKPACTYAVNHTLPVPVAAARA